MKSFYTRLQLMSLFLLVLLMSSYGSVRGLTEEDVRGDLVKAYDAVSRAEVAGADVHVLILMLDEAARMIPGASGSVLEQADQIISSVQTQAPVAQIQGEQRLTNRFIFVALALIILSVLAVAVWFKGSGWFWGLWLKSHSGWRVEKQ
jgi:hypothetical protein